MLDHDIICDKMRDHLQSHLPALFGTAGIDDFQDYLSNEPPSEIENRQLVVYMVEFSKDEDSEAVTITVHCQLPRVSTPQQYETIIGKVVDIYDPAEINAISISSKGMVVYPWQTDDGGSSSFVFYSIQFNAQRDSCD